MASPRTKSAAQAAGWPMKLPIVLARAAALKKWCRENSPSRSSSLLVALEDLCIKKEQRVPENVAPNRTSAHLTTCDRVCRGWGQNGSQPSGPRSLQVTGIPVRASSVVSSPGGAVCARGGGNGQMLQRRNERSLQSVELVKCSNRVGREIVAYPW